jgi:hypothetical protein
MMVPGRPSPVLLVRHNPLTHCLTRPARQLALFAATLCGLTSAATPELYGLSLAANGPAEFNLISLDSSSGKATAIGGKHTELFGTSDLVAIANNALYYLGDTSAGATLVALDLATGAKICSGPVHLAEVGFVGLGQSLDYDPTTDSLIVSLGRPSDRGVYPRACMPRL